MGLTKHTTWVTLVIVLFAYVCASAQQPKTPAKLAAARAKYLKALDKANAEYDESIKLAGEDYKQQLNTM